MEPIATYFNAERLESLFFIAIGVAALAAAACAWAARKQVFYRGTAWPLAIIALIQLGVGAGVYLRSPNDIVRVQQIVQAEPQRLRGEEIPRMEVEMRNFVIYCWIEIALVAMSLLLVALARAASCWRGVASGLLAQAGLMLILDLFAEVRAAIYLLWLRSIPGD